MKITLVRRWGPYSAGRTVDVDAVQGRWLIQHNYGESTPEVQAPVQPAAAEGVHGADPLAGGDATRRRPKILTPERDESVNRAQQGPGVPPTYRAGYDAAAQERDGVAGRHAADAKRPARRRSKSGS